MITKRDYILRGSYFCDKNSREMCIPQIFLSSKHSTVRILHIVRGLRDGGVQPYFSQDTPKFGFGDGQKWAKMGEKVYEKRGKQSFYFQNKKKSHFCP